MFLLWSERCDAPIAKWEMWCRCCKTGVVRTRWYLETILRWVPTRYLIGFRNSLKFLTPNLNKMLSQKHFGHDTAVPSLVLWWVIAWPDMKWRTVDGRFFEGAEKIGIPKWDGNGGGQIHSFCIMLTRWGGLFRAPPLVFLRYLLNKCRYHHQTCSTLSPNIFTHCVKILKSRVS